MIVKYQVGRDRKDHLVQPFVTKARSRQDCPAPCPVSRLFLVHSSRLSRSPSRVVCSSKVPISKLHQGMLDPSSKSLPKKLIGVGPSMDPWGELACARSPVWRGAIYQRPLGAASQPVPTHQTDSCKAPVSLGEALGTCLQSLAEIQVGNVHHVPCVNWADYFVKVIRFVKHNLPLVNPRWVSESMLAFCNHQEGLLRNFPRSWSQSEGTMISQIFL